MIKSLNIISLAVVALLAVSCSDNLFSDDTGEQKAPLIFNASLGSSVSSRTTLDGVQVKWEQTDKVDLYYGTVGTEMNHADYAVGTIDASDARKATLNGFAEESAEYMACYPASSSNSCDADGTITATMPVEQAAAVGSFASGANVSVAYSTTTDLSFKNIGALLALKVLSTGKHTIKNIRLTGTSALTGEAVITQAAIAAGNPTADAINDGINFVKLDCDDGLQDGFYTGESYNEKTGSWEGVTIDVNGSTEPYSDGTGSWSAAKVVSKSVLPSGDNTYYMVVLPGSHTGFVLTFEDSDGKTAVLKSGKDVTIERNSNTLIGEVTLTDNMFKKDASGIYINEVDCGNKKIELYNSNDADVDLSGYYFTKDDDKFWAFPPGTTIPAKGYYVVTCKQDDCKDGPTFGLSGSKGFELKLSNGKKVDKIDNTGESLVVIGDTETYGRKTDGADEWVVFSTGSIGDDNSKGTIKRTVPSPVVLNEIDGYNDDYKFVELYNTSEEEVDITGWMLYKDGDKVWTASDESQTKLQGKGFLVIQFVKKSKDPKQAASGISAKKNVMVELMDNNGASADKFTRGVAPYGETDMTQCTTSFGRNVDGTGSWKLMNTSTPGAANDPTEEDIPQE